MKIIRLLPLLLFLPCLLSAKGKVEQEIHLLAYEDIIGANFPDIETMTDWLKPYMDDMEKALEKEKGDLIVATVIEFHKDRNPSISHHFSLKKSKSISRMAGISTPPPIRAGICDVAILLVSKVNEPPVDNPSFHPELILPMDREKAKFKAMGVGEKIKELQRWSREEVLPVLSYVQSGVEAQFPGVIAVGEMLKKDIPPEKMMEMFDHNPNYWQGMLEMALGDLIVPTSKMFIHLANGEMDIAQNYLDALRFFSKEGNLAHYYMDALSWKMSHFGKQYSTVIEEGIALHDKGEYKAAMTVYEGLKKEFPNSAWREHEMFLSSMLLMGPDHARGLWDTHRVKLFEYNPLYPYYGMAGSPDEGFETYCRLKIKELFQDRDKIIEDVTTYAEICVDLGEYEFAAMLYWYLLPYGKDENVSQSYFAHFFYLQKELGNERLLSIPKKEILDMLPGIEESIINRKKSNIMYQAIEED